MSGMEKNLRTEVEASLRQASDQQLIRVMAFIDRLPSRRVVEDIVSRVRGRLAMVRPARPMTLARVLTLPLEDLLVAPELAATSPWVVPRDLLAVLHRLVLRATPAALLEELEPMCAKRTMDDRETVLDIGQALWLAGAAALRGFLLHGAGGPPPEGWREEFRERLKGILGILEHAADITTFLEQLPPRPMGRLRSDERGAAMSLLYFTGQESEALFRYAFTMLMRRSGEPAEFFELVTETDFDIPIELRDRILAETARDCLLEIDAMNEGMAAPGERSVMATADATQRMVSLIESLENAPSSVKVDARRLSASKAKASEAITRTFEATLSGEVRQTITAIADNPAASDEEVIQAESVARSTKKIELAGNRLGIGGHLGSVLDRELAGYKRMIVRKLASTKGPDAAKLAAVMDELRLLEIVFGAEVALAILDDARAGR